MALRAFFFLLLTAFAGAHGFAAEETCPAFYGKISAFESRGGKKAEVEFIGKLARMMLYPYRNLAGEKDLKVVGRMFSGKEAAEKVYGQLRNYDSEMKEMGFRLPASTRVVMAENTMFIDKFGPFSFNGPLFNVKDFRLPENTISMTSMGTHREAGTSGAILLHERMHGILHATYNDAAFVSRDTTIQESLADFISSLHRNDAQVGRGTVFEGRPLRDLELQKTADGKSVQGIFDLSQTNAHNNSLLFSGALWKLRQKLGQEKMQKLIKPMVDDLNFHYASSGGPGKDVKPAQTDIWNFSYFLSSIRKTLVEQNELAGVKYIDELAASHAIGDWVNQLSAKLSREGNFAYDPKTFTQQALMVNGTVGGMNAAGLTAVGGATYGIIFEAKRENKIREERNKQREIRNRILLDD